MQGQGSRVRGQALYFALDLRFFGGKGAVRPLPYPVTMKHPKTKTDK